HLQSSRTRSTLDRRRIGLVMAAALAVSEETTMQNGPRQRKSGLRRVGTATAIVGSALALSLPVAASAVQPTTTSTTTPIKHLVVIFQENVSFDHYFGTYPKATNSSGQPFYAAHGTPKGNNLADTKGLGGVGTLLTNNPNKDAANNQVNPARLDPATVNGILGCAQDHDYNDEQKAFDGGKMDKFVATVGTASGKSGTGQPCSADDVMNYYDGNTVTALWNYAQQYAMSDNYL